jgi:hypothetical protein
MHLRGVRLLIVALLLAAGAVAAFYVWGAEEKRRFLDSRARGVDEVLDRIWPLLADVNAAQKAYVTNGLRDESTFAQLGNAIAQIRSETARLRSSDYSGEATARLEETWTALSALTATEAEARDQLTAGESLAAADQLFVSTQPNVTALAMGLRGFRVAELRWLDEQRRELIERSHLILMSVGAMWTVALLTLAGVPRPRQSAVPASVAAPPATPPAAPSRARVDLTATANVCVDISQLTDSASLPSVLERAASVLDARGIIVWLGAGENLFAAVAFGYEPAVVERLRPIPRAADNATAATWRTGELRTVAGDASSLGAIVAPMLGPGGCIGVFAAEVRHERESDGATRAAAIILATQLAGVLAEWPGASTAQAGSAPAAPAPPPAHATGSDRQTAAS